VKIQTGIRLDKLLWESYKKLCENEGLRPNEAIEEFLEVCKQKNSIITVLELLKSETEGQKLANKLKLQNLLVDLEIYYNWDRKERKFSNSGIVNNRIQEIIQILPKIREKDLLEKSEKIINEVLDYYYKIMVK